MQTPKLGDMVLYRTRFDRMRLGIITDIRQDGTVDIHVFSAADHDEPGNDPPGSYREGTRADGTIAHVRKVSEGEERYQFRYLNPEPVSAEPETVEASVEP